MDLIEGAPLNEHFNSLKEKRDTFSESRIWNILIQVNSFVCLFCALFQLYFIYVKGCFPSHLSWEDPGGKASRYTTGILKVLFWFLFEMLRVIVVQEIKMSASQPRDWGFKPDMVFSTIFSQLTPVLFNLGSRVQKN